MVPCSLPEEAYVCSNMACPWNNYAQNTDWGYYSTTNGDCAFCKGQCSSVSTCGGIECDYGYCTWWKKGKCATDQERTDHNADVITCLKGNLRSTHRS